MSSQEMDAMKAQMTAIIVRDSEHHFADPKENETLKITVPGRPLLLETGKSHPDVPKRVVGSCTPQELPAYASRSTNLI
jgi:hypothetical protein